MQSILTIESVSKSYVDSKCGILPVLKNISFVLPSNKIIGVLGASGCGKSTLLNIIAGLVSSDSGSIISKFNRPGAKVGYLQQGEKLLPWRSVIDNVVLGLDLCGEKKQESYSLARSMLKEVQMDAYQDFFPSQLSGGMLQRVLLARVLANKPTLLLLDEPLGQLDMLGRKDLAKIIRTYVDQHDVAALLVTHSVEEAVFLSDYILTLSSKPAAVVSRINLTSQQIDGFDQVDAQNAYNITLKSLLSALSDSSRRSDD